MVLLRKPLLRPSWGFHLHQSRRRPSLRFHHYRDRMGAALLRRNILEVTLGLCPKRRCYRRLGLLNQEFHHCRYQRHRTLETSNLDSLLLCPKLLGTIRLHPRPDRFHRHPNRHNLIQRRRLCHNLGWHRRLNRHWYRLQRNPKHRHCRRQRRSNHRLHHNPHPNLLYC